MTENSNYLWFNFLYLKALLWNIQIMEIYIKKSQIIKKKEFISKKMIYGLFLYK